MLPRIISILFALLFGTQTAIAQQNDIVWVQIEAQPSLSQAQTEIRNYAARLQDVNGFSLGGGWYGIALGPYTREDADTVLRVYRRENLIPQDSYITFTSAFERQFWPVGANLLASPLLQDAPEDAPSAVLPAVDEPVANIEVQQADETPREARASEARLNREEKKDLQRLLQWAGFYNSAIDGAFGRGTRRAMSGWQEVNGYEVTGVMTTLQREALLSAYNAVLEGMDLTLVTEAEAGIEMQVPLGVVARKSAEYPFVTYPASGEVPAQVVMISQEGDQTTLFGLYDIMQTLEIVPLNGTRERKQNSFLLIGQDQDIVSHTEVSLRNGEIKGFTLVWPVADEERRRRILDEMRGSFNRIGGVLDPAVGAEIAQDIDLLSGLEIRRPKLSRSGFYTDASGTVVTTSEAVQACQRVTLDENYEAEVLGMNADLGIAVLKPKDRLVPMASATFRQSDPRLKSEIAVAGYSFEGTLGAPSLTFGTLADLRGLGGEAELTRLALNALPGDAGGPVFDAGGSVVGMLLPKAGNGQRKLPEDVSFAAAAEAIQTLLQEAGLRVASRDAADAIAPEDLTTVAGDMTVLVSCW